jgi:hypothetical protein
LDSAWLQPAAELERQPREGRGLFDKLAAALRTRFGVEEVSLQDVKRILRTVQLAFWAGVSVPDGGDVMDAYTRASMTGDRRDKFFVRVSLFTKSAVIISLIHYQYEAEVDEFEDDPNADEQMVIKTFFGRLEHVVSFTLPTAQELGLDEPLYIVFTAIRTCNIANTTADIATGLDYLTGFSSLDILDLSCLQCVIGRVDTRGRVAVIDRTGSLQRSWYNDDGTDDPDEE